MGACSLRSLLVGRAPLSVLLVDAAIELFAHNFATVSTARTRAHART